MRSRVGGMSNPSPNVIECPTIELVARIVDPVSFEKARGIPEVLTDAAWRCDRARDKAVAIAVIYAERERALTAELRAAREYVSDALDAHEHSDGRELLQRIDAILPAKNSNV